MSPLGYDPKYKYRFISPSKVDQWKLFDWEVVSLEEMVKNGITPRPDLVLVRRTWESLEAKAPEKAMKPTRKEVRDAIKEVDKAEEPVSNPAELVESPTHEQPASIPQEETNG